MREVFPEILRSSRGTARPRWVPAALDRSEWIGSMGLRMDRSERRNRSPRRNPGSIVVGGPRRALSLRAPRVRTARCVQAQLRIYDGRGAHVRSGASVGSGLVSRDVGIGVALQAEGRAYL